MKEALEVIEALSEELDALDTDMMKWSFRTEEYQQLRAKSDDLYIQLIQAANSYEGDPNDLPLSIRFFYTEDVDD